jgi:hypothetical protein
VKKDEESPLSDEATAARARSVAKLPRLQAE